MCTSRTPFSCRVLISRVMTRGISRISALTSRRGRVQFSVENA